MGTGRDDFSKSTIRKAAERVGYRCSFPGCHNATVGASMEGADKTSVTGVAAHICAAAEGGPRYDPNMAVDERKGIENCIWLCQTHSKLIDTDVETYTVEKLRQWKADAEADAAMALANGDYFSEYYKGHGNNLNTLKQMFDDMVAEGNFDRLQTMLGQYQTTLSEQYEEFVFRYRIVYDVYCDRAKLGEHLNAYCNLACKSGVDNIAELFLAFHLNEELSRIIDFITSEQLKQYGKMAVKNELMSSLIVPVGAVQTISAPPELSDVISKYITNHIVQNKIIGAIDATGAEYSIFADEFYYHAIKAVYELACESIYGKDNIEDIITNSNFLFIKDNIDKINLLDTSLQEYIWGQFLAFLAENPEQFETYYESCSPSAKRTLLVEKAYYSYRIMNDATSVESTALLDYVSRSDDDAILCLYLTRIERNTAIEFLDEHGYLFKKNSIYLKVKLDMLPDIQPKEARNFLERYKEIYAEDFTFHLLLAEHTTSDQAMNEELEWLKAEQQKMKLRDGMDYIRILYKHQRWTDLAVLSQLRLPNEYMFMLAGCLCESEDESHVKIACKLYQDLANTGWKRRGLYFNLGVAQRKLGDFENAKENFKNEYDLYAENYSLHAFIRLRYELNEYVTDSYFNQLKESINSESQNLIAAIYLKSQNYSDARKYFLRSLLINDSDNLSINGFFQATSHLPNEEISEIKENVCCVLKSVDEVRSIAIHEDGIMEDIVSPCTFANFTHYSVQNAKISSLLFAHNGEHVIWNGKEYEVAEIMSANDAINRFFFSTLSEKKGVTLIRSSDSEDLIKQISSILKRSSENLNERINEYNQLDLRPPLSTFAAITGKGMLRTCEFLAFENSEKIRNNTVAENNISDALVFVLSYDSIVYLTHLGIENDLLNKLDLRCSAQVKNQLMNDINEELSELTDNNQKGTMFYKDGSFSIFEHTSNMRRVRHAFLTRLKAFLNALSVQTNMPFSSACAGKQKDEIEKLFSTKHLYCESTSLSAAQNTANAVLVTDDQFLYSIANSEDIPSIGLTGLISKANLDWSSLLSASKKLRDMNYANYLPVHLYGQIVDQMLKSESDHNSASAEIQAWVLSDTDGKATRHHEDVVIALLRDVTEQDLSYLNPNHFLTDIVLSVLEKRHPGFIEECVTNAFNSLMGSWKETDLHETME